MIIIDLNCVKSFLCSSELWLALLCVVYIYTFFANCSFFVVKYDKIRWAHNQNERIFVLFLYCMISFLLAPIWLILHIMWRIGKTANFFFGYK